MTDCYNCGDAQMQKWTTSRWVTLQEKEMWIQVQGATSNLSCACVPGTFLFESNCVDCMEGSTCPGSDSLQVLPGMQKLILTNPDNTSSIRFSLTRFSDALLRRVRVESQHVHGLTWEATSPQWMHLVRSTAASEMLESALEGPLGLVPWDATEEVWHAPDASLANMQRQGC